MSYSWSVEGGMSEQFTRSLMTDFWEKHKKEYECFVSGELHIVKMIIEDNQELCIIAQTANAAQVTIYLKFLRHGLEPHRFHIGKSSNEQ